MISKTQVESGERYRLLRASSLILCFYFEGEKTNTADMAFQGCLHGENNLMLLYNIFSMLFHTVQNCLITNIGNFNFMLIGCQVSLVGHHEVK